MPGATPPKVFIDTNVWFSVFYGSENCEKIIKAHFKRKITAVVSQQVLEESVRNIREKIPFALALFEKLISSYPPELVLNPKSINSKIKKLTNPADQPILASAIIAKADYFVTGNTKDFKTKTIKQKYGVSILTPNEAVKLLKL